MDDEDFEYLNQWKWYTHKPNPLCCYAKRTIRETAQQKTVQMHRLIMGAQKGQLVDHVDGNGLNNQRSNLRLCSRPQNSRNRRKHKPTSSFYMGVSWCKKLNMWVAQISTNNKKINLGRFLIEKEAAEAYNKAALKFHGEFARINQIK